MKKIFIVGDSISQGYTLFVREALEGKAEVYWRESCRFAEFTFRHVHDWKNQLGLDKVDVVHWNVGLWDVVILFNDELLTPPEIYEYYIDRICKRLKFLFPDAKIIFATSTPVIEKRYDNDFRRENKDIERYNEIALKVVKKYGFEINDLFTVAKGAPEYAYSDATHLYTQKGTELMTDAVLRSIAPHIGVDVDKLNYHPEFRAPDSFMGK